MAEQGKSLDDILGVLNSLVKPNLGTIGLSLTPCVVPGRAEPSFVLANDQMELGLGRLYSHIATSEPRHIFFGKFQEI